MLGNLLTAWGQPRAGNYANMRRMHIRPTQATRTAELGETQKCPECCLCPQHGGLVAWDQPERLAATARALSDGTKA